MTPEEIGDAATALFSAEITGAAGREDVLAASDYICPSLGVLDRRIARTDPETGALRTAVDAISENGPMQASYWARAA